MKILFVLEHYHPYIGGAETLFRDLSRALAANGHEVRVITTRYRADLPTRETIAGVEIKRVRCFNRFLFSAFALPAVVRWAGWADFVHTTTYNAALPAWLGARLRRRKVIITFHELWGDLWLRLPFLSPFSARLFRAYEALVLALPFDHYIAVSDFTARSLVEGGVGKAKVRRIYNGLDYTSFSGERHQPPEHFTYTYFGRLGVSKGLDLIIPAAAQFQQNNPQAILRLIIPKRPAGMYQEVIQLLNQYGLTDKIELRHELSEADLREAVLTSSCVLITSYSEGFCFVAAETASAGVPIISSGRGALPETVSGPHLVMPEMSAAALTDCLEQAKAGEWAFSPLRKFTASNSVATYLEFYAEILE